MGHGVGQVDADDLLILDRHHIGRLATAELEGARPPRITLGQGDVGGLLAQGDGGALGEGHRWPGTRESRQLSHDNLERGGTATAVLVERAGGLPSREVVLGGVSGQLVAEINRELRAGRNLGGAGAGHILGNAERAVSQLHVDRDVEGLHEGLRGVALEARTIDLGGVGVDESGCGQAVVAVHRDGVGQDVVRLGGQGATHLNGDGRALRGRLTAGDLQLEGARFGRGRSVRAPVQQELVRRRRVRGGGRARQRGAVALSIAEADLSGAQLVGDRHGLHGGAVEGQVLALLGVLGLELLRTEGEVPGHRLVELVHPRGALGQVDRGIGGLGPDDATVLGQVDGDRLRAVDGEVERLLVSGLMDGELDLARSEGRGVAAVDAALHLRVEGAGEFGR